MVTSRLFYTGAIYQMVGQIADALGGVGWDALALALGHITPEIRVHAGADLGQGNGELVGGEEPGVFRLTAGDGVQGHQGEAHHRRLGGGQSAGLGEIEVAGPEVEGHLIGGLNQSNSVAVFLLQIAVKAAVGAADDDEMGLAVKLADQLPHGPFQHPGTHASAGDQQIGLLRVQPQGLAGGLPCGLLPKGPANGNAEGIELFPGDAPALKLREQVGVGDHIGVTVRFLGEGDAGVIGGDKDGLGQSHALGFEPGHDLGGEEVGHEDGVKAVLGQEDLHGVGGSAVGKIDGRAPGELAVKLPQGVGRTEEAGRLLHQGHISVADPADGAVALQSIGVHEHRLIAPTFAFLPQGFRRGVVSAAGAAGQDQDLHSTFTATRPRSSLLRWKRRSTAQDKSRKPPHIARGQEKISRTRVTR